MAKKSSEELTLEQVKAIPLTDEQLDKVNGGMAIDYVSNAPDMTFEFNIGEAVYDEEEDCNAYVVSRWYETDPADGLFRCCYCVGGVYNGVNMSWNAWERELNHGWR